MTEQPVPKTDDANPVDPVDVFHWSLEDLVEHARVVVDATATTKELPQDLFRAVRNLRRAIGDVKGQATATDDAAWSAWFDGALEVSRAVHTVVTTYQRTPPGIPAEAEFDKLSELNLALVKNWRAMDAFLGRPSVTCSCCAVVNDDS